MIKLRSVVVYAYLLFIIFPVLSSNELFINTTYQAEDVNISVDNHPQCTAWKLWWRTQDSNKDLSPDDINLLAYRRRTVSIFNNQDAQANHIPLDLLRNYSAIYINFEMVCRMYPRVLKILSSNAANRYQLNISAICDLANMENLEDIKENRDSIFNNCSETLDHCRSNSSENFQLLLNNSITNMSISLGLINSLFTLHQSISIDVGKVCKDGEEKEVNENIDFQYYRDKYGSFGFDVETLDITIEELLHFMNNTDHLDNIMRSFDQMSLVGERPFPSTYILPYLKKIKYDSRSPPVLFVSDQVTVKIGLHIQSMSNFELSTMDYDVDAWLRMAWFDPRLRHGSSRPVLINEYTFLKKIWRPDPIFTNSKAATFHKVTYLNFFMFIFPSGEVFLNIRVYLKPTAAQIVLCKYPHDSPACSLKISSLGFTQDVVRFEWFSKLDDAIQLNHDLQIPELTLLNFNSSICDGTRKSGNYSCLEAHFYLKREIGYHIAQTYIPTAICVVFSWISVWLPEEFVEGRIFVSLTVFLTLSAESNSAKEELPKVSYIKAIDIWFGFTSTFVFLTMLQALIVISLEHSSKRLKKKCEKHLENYSNYHLMIMMMRSRYYHRVARNIDSFCKVMYPVTFILFLIIYGFVIIQGDERKCLQPSS